MSVCVYIYVYIYSLFTHYFYFWLGWSSQLCGLFSSCGERGLLSGFGAGVSHCGGLSCRRAWALGCVGSVVAAPSSKAHAQPAVQLLHSMWDFPDQGSNFCLLYWQVDSLPLNYQEALWNSNLIPYAHVWASLLL